MSAGLLVVVGLAEHLLTCGHILVSAGDVPRAISICIEAVTCKGRVVAYARMTPHDTQATGEEGSGGVRARVLWQPHSGDSDEARALFEACRDHCIERSVDPKGSGPSGAVPADATLQFDGVGLLPDSNSTS